MKVAALGIAKDLGTGFLWLWGIVPPFPEPYKQRDEGAKTATEPLGPNEPQNRGRIPFHSPPTIKALKPSTQEPQTESPWNP